MRDLLTKKSAVIFAVSSSIFLAYYIYKKRPDRDIFRGLTGPVPTEIALASPVSLILLVLLIKTKGWREAQKFIPAALIPPLIFALKTKFGIEDRNRNVSDKLKTVGYSAIASSLIFFFFFKEKSIFPLPNEINKILITPVATLLLGLNLGVDLGFGSRAASLTSLATGVLPLLIEDKIEKKHLYSLILPTIQLFLSSYLIKRKFQNIDRNIIRRNRVHSIERDITKNGLFYIALNVFFSLYLSRVIKAPPNLSSFISLVGSAALATGIHIMRSGRLAGGTHVLPTLLKPDIIGGLKRNIGLYIARDGINPPTKIIFEKISPQVPTSSNDFVGRITKGFVPRENCKLYTFVSVEDYNDTANEYLAVGLNNVFGNFQDVISLHGIGNFVCIPGICGTIRLMKAKDFGQFLVNISRGIPVAGNLRDRARGPIKLLVCFGGQALLPFSLCYSSVAQSISNSLQRDVYACQTVVSPLPIHRFAIFQKFTPQQNFF